MTMSLHARVGRPVDAGTKPCDTCGQVLGIRQYGIAPENPDGRKGTCKGCLIRRARMACRDGIEAKDPVHSGLDCPQGWLLTSGACLLRRRISERSDAGERFAACRECPVGDRVEAEDALRDWMICEIQGERMRLASCLDRQRLARPPHGELRFQACLTCEQGSFNAAGASLGRAGSHPGPEPHPERQQKNIGASPRACPPEPRKVDPAPEKGTARRAPTNSEEDHPVSETKICAVCGAAKPLEDYPTHNMSRDGRARTCWICKDTGGQSRAARRKAIAGHKSQAAQATAPATPPQDDGPAPSLVLTLDLTPWPEILDGLRAEAARNIRTPEQHAIWILRTWIELDQEGD